MAPKPVLQLHVKMKQGVMAMKEYSTITRSQALEPRQQIQFSVIPRTPLCGGGGLTLLQRIQLKYFKPHCRGNGQFKDGNDIVKSLK